MNRPEPTIDDLIPFVTDEQKFRNAFVTIQRLAHLNSDHKGFWAEDRGKPFEDVALKKFCLIHGEISEAQEGVRHSNPSSEHIPEFSAVEEELADAIIRIMDFSEEFKFRTAEAVLAKMKFNAQRPFMHGKKC